MTPKGPRWTGKVVLVPEKLEEPLRWKKPRRIFVNSMSDLFHEGLTDTQIQNVFSVMESANHHVYQVLTKRPQRMLDFVKKFDEWLKYASDYPGHLSFEKRFSHVWLGVSVEDQKTADERIPLLLQTPAAVRWISAEPMLGPINLNAIACRGAGYLDALSGRGHDGVTPDDSASESLDWIVVGGESGPKARGLDVSWARSIVRQCRAATVPVFMKQLGAHPFERRAAEGPQGVRAALANIEKPHPQRTWFGNGWTLISKGEISEWVKGYTLKDKKGGDMSEFPEDLRIREYPKAAA